MAKQTKPRKSKSTNAAGAALAKPATGGATPPSFGGKLQLKEFRDFLAEAKESDYVQVWAEPTLQDIYDSGNYAEGNFKIKEFKYKIEGGTGDVWYTFIPRWMRDAMHMYHTYKYYDMTIVEFLDTMTP